MMEEGSKLNFENKVANNFFKFLSREFYSKTIDNIELFKFILKVLTINKSKHIIYKYICLLFQVLKNIVNKDNITQVHYIINEALSSVLKTKHDYILIIRYIVFLIEIDEEEIALKSIKELTLNQHYMNNGEIYFYTGLLEFMRNKHSPALVSQNFEKAINFISFDEIKYIDWITKFFSANNYIKELRELLKIEKVRRLFNNGKIALYQVVSDYDNIDLLNKVNEFLCKLDILSKELTTNLWELDVFLKYDSLIEKIQMKHKKKKFEKILNVNKNYIFVYINFLVSYFVFEPFKPIVLQKLLTVFQEEIGCIWNSSISENHQQQLKDSILSIIETNFPVLIKIVVLRSLIKRLLNISENFQTLNMGSEEVQIISNFIQIMNYLSLYLRGKTIFPENLILSKNFSLNTVKSLILLIRNLKF